MPTGTSRLLKDGRADRRRPPPSRGSPPRSASTRAHGPTRSATIVASLERIAGARPRAGSLCPGHGEPIDDPAGRGPKRSSSITASGLDETAAALGGGPSSGYELSHVLFAGELAAAAAAVRRRRGAFAPRAARASRAGRRAEVIDRIRRPILSAVVRLRTTSASVPAPRWRGVTLSLRARRRCGARFCLNGFFVAAEYALVTVRRTRLHELAQRGQPARARRCSGSRDAPPRFIAAMQLGVTVTSLAIGALGEHALAKLFDPVMATALAVILRAASC